MLEVWIPPKTACSPSGVKELHSTRETVSWVLGNDVMESAYKAPCTAPPRLFLLVRTQFRHDVISTVTPQKANKFASTKCHRQLSSSSFPELSQCLLVGIRIKAAKKFYSNELISLWLAPPLSIFWKWKSLKPYFEVSSVHLTGLSLKTSVYLVTSFYWQDHSGGLLPYFNYLNVVIRFTLRLTRAIWTSLSHIMLVESADNLGTGWQLKGWV